MRYYALLKKVMKAISIRLDDKLGKEFDQACRRTGYKKNTLLSRMIASFVKRQKEIHPLGFKKAKDPFEKVIGLMEVGSLVPTEDLLDKVVYDL